MATTKYGVNDALTVKRWARRLSVEALKATEIAPLIGTSATSVVHLKNEVKEGGDQVTFGLRMQLTGDGVTENEVQEGNEEALSTYSDSVTINELVHAVRVKGEGTIDNQRVLFNARDEARDGLKDWYAKRISQSFFNQVCGYTAQTNSKYTGLNAVRAPSANRHIWVNGSDDQSLASGHTMTLQMITYAKELAETADVPIRPIMVNGAKKYVIYLHPYQITDLKIEAQASGAISWADIQLAALAAKDSSNNPIYTGALGEFDGVVIRSAYDVTPGVNSSTGASVANVRRAVFLGAQAAAMAYGKNVSTGSPYKWVEKTFDYDRELGVSAQTVMGLRKTQFDSEDFGSIVVSSYAAAHS